MEENAVTERKGIIDELSEPDSFKAVSGVRSSTRLLNKQKNIPDEVLHGPASDIQCTCALPTCAICSNTPSTSSKVLLTTKKRDFWSIQEQSDFFDGLKLYGKEINSIFVHMKSVAKRRARIMTVGIPNSTDSSLQQSSATKVKTKEQIRHFYYRKLQLCQRLIGDLNYQCLQNHPRDIREVYVLLCYDALKKVFRDKLDPRLARPDFSIHLNHLISNGYTVVRVGRKGRFRVKTPICQALRVLSATDVRTGVSGEIIDSDIGSVRLPGGNNGTSLLSTLPDSMIIELVPSDNFTWGYVQSLAHNPRVLITAKSNTKIHEIQQLLEKKWCSKGYKQPQNVNYTNEGKIVIHFKTSDLSRLQEFSDQSQRPRSEEIHQMTLIEIFLLLNGDSQNEPECVVKLDYSVKLTETPSQPLNPQKIGYSTALNKLLYMSTLRLKFLSQQQSSRFVSPKQRPLNRVDEEAVDSHWQQGNNSITPRRKSVQCGPVQNQAQQLQTVNGNSAPASSATAVNFIEQLRELRGKTRKSRGSSLNAGDSNQVDVSPKLPQHRRLLPKPTSAGLVESQMQYQSIPQTILANHQRERQVVMDSSMNPSMNIVITPIQQSQNFHVSESAVDNPPQTSSYIPSFADASLDISLPGEATLSEMLKPASLHQQQPSQQSNSTRETSGINQRPSAVLDLDSSNIINARPLSPSASAALDISFGDPSLGGLLSAADVGKPWLIQDNSSMGFFEDNSFLLPANNNATAPSISQPPPVSR